MNLKRSQTGEEEMPFETHVAQETKVSRKKCDAYDWRNLATHETAGMSNDCGIHDSQMQSDFLTFALPALSDVTTQWQLQTSLSPFSWEEEQTIGSLKPI